jgi:hypothetical protein
MRARFSRWRSLVRGLPSGRRTTSEHATSIPTGKRIGCRPLVQCLAGPVTTRLRRVLWRPRTSLQKPKSLGEPLHGRQADPAPVDRVHRRDGPQAGSIAQRLAEVGVIDD